MMKPTALSLALEEANHLLGDDNRYPTWVRIDATVRGLVILEWGTIHNINGSQERERAIASRRFEQRDNAVEIGPVFTHS